MIYLDSSALLKLIFQEAESAALQQWLSERSAMSIVSSELAKAEVLRGARRIDPSALIAARSLVTHIDLIHLGGAVIDAAADIDDPVLRTLDALHLASALSLGSDLVAFVAYDKRLLAAAKTAGLTTVTPAAARSTTTHT